MLYTFASNKKMVTLILPSGFLKLVTLKTKSIKTRFGPIKPTNPSVRMAYKGQSSFGILTIFYTYQVCKTLFRPIKPTNPSARMACKDQSIFGKLILLQECAYKISVKLGLRQSLTIKQFYPNVETSTDTDRHENIPHLGRFLLF